MKLKSRAQIYDEILVIKCQQGEKIAFEELVERWQKRFWNYAFTVTGSEAVAWDIVQETWIGIIKGINKLEDVAVFPRWAFRIANNKCADWLRKQQIQSRLDNQLAEQRQRDEISGQQNEKLDSLSRTLERLSPDSRALLALRYREGFDISQIAEILGVAEGTIKSRISRTLDQLRRMVEQNKDG